MSAAGMHANSLAVSPQLTVICFRRPESALGPLFVVREWDAKVIRATKKGPRGQPKAKTPSTEQALRANVRQAILNLNLRLEAANKIEIQYLKSVGILGKRAPSCSLLYANDLLRLLYCFDKKKYAEELKAALADDSNFKAEDEPGLIMPRVQIRSHYAPKPVALSAFPKQPMPAEAYPIRQVEVSISKATSLAVAKAVRAGTSSNGSPPRRLLEPGGAGAAPATLPPSRSAKRKAKNTAPSAAGLDALLSVLGKSAADEEDEAEDEGAQAYGAEEQQDAHEWTGAPLKRQKSEEKNAATLIAAAAAAAATPYYHQSPALEFYKRAQQQQQQQQQLLLQQSMDSSSGPDVHFAVPVARLRGHGGVLPSALVMPVSPSGVPSRSLSSSPAFRHNHLLSPLGGSPAPSPSTSPPPATPSDLIQSLRTQFNPDEAKRMTILFAQKASEHNRSGSTTGSSSIGAAAAAAAAPGSGSSDSDAPLPRASVPSSPAMLMSPNSMRRFLSSPGGIPPPYPSIPMPASALSSLSSSSSSSSSSKPPLALPSHLMSPDLSRSSSQQQRAGAESDASSPEPGLINHPAITVTHGHSLSVESPFGAQQQHHLAPLSSPLPAPFSITPEPQPGVNGSDDITAPKQLQLNHPPQPQTSLQQQTSDGTDVPFSMPLAFAGDADITMSAF